MLDGVCAFSTTSSGETQGICVSLKVQKSGNLGRSAVLSSFSRGTIVLGRNILFKRLWRQEDPSLQFLAKWSDG